MKRQSGMTLMELIIAALIVSIGVLAAVWSFQFISTSIQHSKSRTLSNNLGQEQIEKLKNLSYYSLLVTTAAFPDTHFPSITYDKGYYSPTPLVEGGISFTRATRIDYVVQNGSNITIMPPTTEDTGIKQITVYTIWQEANGGWQYKEIHNLMANPATNPLNATITGSVLTGISPIANALVQAIDNPQYYAYTNSAGIYSFTVSEGSYTLRASSQGYFTQDTPSYITVNSGGSSGYTFHLTAMSSGAVSGYVYRNDHPLVSQVVAATGTVPSGGGLNQDIEYIELYNPTISSVFVGTNSLVNTPTYVPVLWDKDGTGYIHRLFYVNSSIPSHGYYLISNTGDATPATTCLPFVVKGVSVQPDACWLFVAAPNHAFECGGQPCSGNTNPDAGGVSLANNSSYSSLPGTVINWPSAKIDTIAWSKNSSGHACPSSAKEGTCMSTTGGLVAGEQFVRMSGPGSLSTTYGRAYDTDSNNSNFFDFGSMLYNAYNTSTIFAPVAGTPAAGAVVNLDDPLSNTAVTDSAGFFTAPSVATGTWTLNITTGTLFAQVSPVTVQASVSTSVPNGSTTPTWPATGLPNTLITGTTSYAFVSGFVKSATLSPLSHIKVIDGNGRYTYSASNGQYLLLASTGIPINITANPNDSDMTKSYVTMSKSQQTLSAGLLYDENSWPASPIETTDFSLSLGGILVGYYQTASNTAIPGRVGVAYDTSCSGTSIAQAISDNTGHFFLMNLSTGSYCIQPSLDPAETSSPQNYSPVWLTSTGLSTAYSTFTITNGLSEITGQAQVGVSSNPITTGVLVVASTVSLGTATLPPKVSGATGILCSPCYYAASSDATGVYSLSVRSSATPYYLYGWYGTTRSGPYSVNVSTAGLILSQTVSW